MKDERMKVAVYGGTFNPVHSGHIVLAQTLLSRGVADQVVFMPNSAPDWKVNANDVENPAEQLASFEDRCEMIQIAIKGMSPKIILSRIESELPQPSYTLQTLDALAHKWLHCDFAWVIGYDELMQLHKWDPDPIRLVRSYDFISYPRAGYPVDLMTLNKHWPGWLCRKLLDGVLFDIPNIGISSSEVRFLISMGSYAMVEASMLPNGIIDYIRAHGLYGANQKNERKENSVFNRRCANCGNHKDRATLGIDHVYCTAHETEHCKISTCSLWVPEQKDTET